MDECPPATSTRECCMYVLKAKILTSGSKNDTDSAEKQPTTFRAYYAVSKQIGTNIFHSPVFSALRLSPE